LGAKLQEKNVKHTGSITLSDVIEIARVMRPRSCAKNLAGTCKEILGTAVSVGCKVDGKHPSAIMAAVSGSGDLAGHGQQENVTR
jgi:large subunit ribosomal protein L12e